MLPVLHGLMPRNLSAQLGSPSQNRSPLNARSKPGQMFQNRLRNVKPNVMNCGEWLAVREFGSVCFNTYHSGSGLLVDCGVHFKSRALSPPTNMAKNSFLYAALLPSYNKGPISISIWYCLDWSQLGTTQFL